MDNNYIITSIDPATNTVSVTFNYNENSSAQFLVLDAVDNPDVISQACSDAYLAYSVLIDNTPVLTPDVVVLIDQPVDQSQQLSSRNQQLGGNQKFGG